MNRHFYSTLVIKTLYCLLYWIKVFAALSFCILNYKIISNSWSCWRTPYFPSVQYNISSIMSYNVTLLLIIHLLFYLADRRLYWYLKLHLIIRIVLVCGTFGCFILWSHYWQLEILQLYMSRVYNKYRTFM